MVHHTDHRHEQIEGLVIHDHHHREVAQVTADHRVVLRIALVVVTEALLHRAVHPVAVTEVVGRHLVAHQVAALAEVPQEVQVAQVARVQEGVQEVVVVVAEDNICLTKESLRQ